MASGDRNRQEKPKHWSNFRPRPIKSLTVPRTLTDCCYSICNIALLVAAIVALVYLVKFLTDDPLYEYGEHLLSLRFYRQLIYVIVIVPLVILVPLFNTFSSFIITKQLQTEFGESLTKVKIIFQIFVAFLVFIALFFIAPNMRHSPLASQIELEIRKHMMRFYNSEFSFNFLDLLQNEYRCCDVLWYRSNFSHHLPMSCLQPDGGLYDIPHKQTCSEVLAALVSHRCFVIAVCFIIIMVALVCLVSIDLLECTALNGREYKLRDGHQIDSASNKSPSLLDDRAKYPLTAYGDAASKQRQQQQQTKVKSPISDIGSGSSGLVRAHRVVTTDDDNSDDDNRRECDPIDVERVSDDDDDEQVRERFRRYDAARTTATTTATSGSLGSRQSAAPLLTTRSIDDDCGDDYRRYAVDYQDDDSGDNQHRYQASFRATQDPYNRTGQRSPAMASRLANSAVLARANLLHTEPVRPKSPVFLVDESAQRPAPPGAGSSSSASSSSSLQVSSPSATDLRQHQPQRTQTRYLHSVLKKQTVCETTSSERHRSRSIWDNVGGSGSSSDKHHQSSDGVDNEPTGNTSSACPATSTGTGTSSGTGTGTGNPGDLDDSERFRAHQRDLQRDLQTRRSLLSVRFAD